MKSGDVSGIAPIIYEILRKDTISFRGMPEAMDIMSGISGKRLNLVRRQAESSLLGDLLNFPMPHLAGAFGLEPLEDDFRAPLKTDTPTLVLTSTLDGRTYPEGARDALKYFSNLDHVIVNNGGHNVFMQAPVISEIIMDYMRGEDVPNELTLNPPKFLY